MIMKMMMISPPAEKKSTHKKETTTTTTGVGVGGSPIIPNTTKRDKWGKQRHFARPKHLRKVSFSPRQKDLVYEIPNIHDENEKSSIWFSSIDLKNIQKRAYEMSQKLLDDSHSACNSRPSSSTSTVNDGGGEGSSDNTNKTRAVSITTHTLDAEIEKKYGDSARGLELINQFHERQRLSGQSARSLIKNSRTSSVASVVWKLNIKEEDSKGAEDDSTNFKPSRRNLPAGRESIMIAHAYCLGSEKSMRRATKIAQLDKQYVDEYVDFKTMNAAAMSKCTKEEKQHECITKMKKLTADQIQDICMRLLIGLKVQDRTFHFKTYGKCFVANQAVDFMIEDGIVNNRHEGVLLGQYLQTKLKLWHHVCNDHKFMDEYLFFRFAPCEQFNDAFSKLSI